MACCQCEDYKANKEEKEINIEAPDDLPLAVTSVAAISAEKPAAEKSVEAEKSVDQDVSTAAGKSVDKEVSITFGEKPSDGLKMTATMSSRSNLSLPTLAKLELKNPRTQSQEFKASLEADTDILRAIDLRKSLQRGGLLWRKSPLDLPMEKRERLWTYSQPTTYFDIFLSHTWWTPGWEKVLALLFQSGLLLAGLIMVLVSVVIVILYIYEILPRQGSYKIKVMEFFDDISIGFFLPLLGSMATALALLLSPQCPQLCGKKFCFLDVVSIHQTNEDIKLRGIYGLGGFVTNSKELRVLWSRPYLSRLWCVFELAAFRKANPEGFINFCPLYVELSVAVTWLFMFGFALIATTVMMGNPGPATLFVVYTVPTVPMPFLIHLVRKSNLAKHKLTEELANFDLEQLQCRSDFDREFVMKGIDCWYGSPQAFSEFIRGPIRQEFLGKVDSSGMTLKYAFIASTPIILLSVEILVGLYMAGTGTTICLVWTFAHVISFSILWVTMILKAIMMLSDKFARPHPNRWKNYLKSFYIYLVLLALVIIAVPASLVAYRTGVAVTGAWTAFALLINWLSFDGYARISSYRQKAAKEDDSACEKDVL